MPIYDYKCPCGGELMDWPVPRAEADNVTCPECGEVMVRQMSPPTLQSERYRPAAIMSDGSRVKGHFGKTATRRGRRD